jgi:thiol-disulfide isomerase/thioredoxin
MKSIKILAIIALPLCFLCSCGPDGYVIEGTITGDSDGKSVYLLSGESGKPVDSTVIAENKFRFTGQLPYPGLYRLKIIKEAPAENTRTYQPIIPLFLENEKIIVSAMLDSIPDEMQLMLNRYSYEDITIEGSASHGIYLSYLSDKGRYDARRSEIFNEYISYLNPRTGEEKGSITEGIDIVTRIDMAAAERDDYVRQFIKDNRSNHVGLFAAGSTLGNYSVNEISEIVAAIDPVILETGAGKKFLENAGEVQKTAIGAKFADFELNDAEGNPVRLSDFAGKGQYVLLEFWASWCGPCKADIPHLKDVYKAYHPEGFEIIGISLDDKKEDWVGAISLYDIQWLQFSDLKAFNSEVAKTYKVSGIPTCVLLGPDGSIVTRNMRGSWMDKRLIEIYGNKFQ